MPTRAGRGPNRPAASLTRDSYEVAALMKLRIICKSKIHLATVTAADLHYIGSIGIDRAPIIGGSACDSGSLGAAFRYTLATSNRSAVETP